jgi:hypothetical protein
MEIMRIDVLDGNAPVDAVVRSYGEMHRLSDFIDDAKRALEAAPTPPAQDDEPVYQINLGPDKWRDVDKEAFDQVTIDAPQKRVLYTRPQPKAQEDEPVAVVTEENGEQVIDITRLMTLSRGTKIYARPANDELRRAAEEVLRSFDNYMQQESRLVELIALIENLRAALEK